MAWDQARSCTCSQQASIPIYMKPTPYRIVRIEIKDKQIVFPGRIGRRHATLGAALSMQVLGRDWHERLDVTSFDSVHVPPDLEATMPLKRWVVYDFNVRRELDQAQLLQLKHRCFLASYQNDGL